jgi:hypothetical protein
MPIGTCENCLYSKVSNVRGHDKLTCHRYAPSPLSGGSGQGWADYEWPVVHAEEFCGEWALNAARGK